MAEMSSRRAVRRGPALLALLVLWWSAALPALSQASPTLTVSPDSGRVGETVAVDGAGFDRDRQVEVTLDGDTVATVAVDGPDWTGPDTFRTTFVVPDRPADPTRAGYDVVGVQDGEPVARDVFTIVPTLSIVPARGPGGSEATVSGTGWDRTEPLTIELPEGRTITSLSPGDPAWSGQSRFSTTVGVPDLIAGAYTVQAHQFRRKLLQETQFTVEATLTVDPDIGRVGSVSDATGTGFVRDFPLDLVFDGEVVVTVPADDPAWTSGTAFTTPFEVPSRPSDRYVVEARQDCDGGCDISATALFTVAGLTLEADPSSGPIRTATEVRGGGFEPDLPVTVAFDDGDVVEVPASTVSAAGTFTTSIAVPVRIAGPYSITACQRCDAADELRASTEFRVEPTLTLIPVRGPAAEETVASGTAFDPALDLTLVFDGETAAEVPAATGVVAADTTFQAPFTVPLRPHGDYVVAACQRCGEPDEIRAIAPFEVLPSLELDPSLGPPGFVTLAVGRGFPADASVLLQWDPGIGSRQVTAGADGTFRVPFLVHQRDQTAGRLGRAVLPANEGLPEAEQVPEPDAPFLVVPGSLQPDDFVVRR